MIQKTSVASILPVFNISWHGEGLVKDCLYREEGKANILKYWTFLWYLLAMEYLGNLVEYQPHAAPHPLTRLHF